MATRKSKAVDDVEQIKRLCLKAIFTPDIALERFVLKGGNAINFFYDSPKRFSKDIDISMEGRFTEQELVNLKSTLIASLDSILASNSYKAIELELVEVPPDITDDVKGFWGGVKIHFKVISLDLFTQYHDDQRLMRHNAISLDSAYHKKFEVDISYSEYCQRDTLKNIDGVRLYVYSPVMIVTEKLRAICQQLPEYREYVPGVNRKPRTKDFFDIYNRIKTDNLDLFSVSNMSILRIVFNKKHVPIEFLALIKNHREFYGSEYSSLEKTVFARVELKSFDFYFDYVVDLAERLFTCLSENKLAT